MRYVALLRGINTGRTVKMEDLRRVFESLGFEDVRTVLATGNVVFETRRTAAGTLTRRIEEALERELGYPVAVVVRTVEQLERLLAAKPFAKVDVTPKTRLHVSFLNQPKRKAALPPGPGYEVVKTGDGAVFSVVDLSKGKTPDLMRALDKELGTDVTTRTWSTVERIVRAAG